MNINEVLPLFENVKQSGGSYTARCPVCGDSHHLYITPEQDKVLFYCQKCNAGFAEIVKLVNLPKDNQPPTIVEQYDHIYKNTDGTVAYCKQRTKYSNGKKKFTFHYTADGKKVFKKPKFCNNLYQLDQLEQADSDTTLYIVEGEKCADSMAKHGFLTTTTNTGAGGKLTFSGTDLRLLAKFENKVVIPDNDEAGMTYCDNFPDAKVLFLKDIWPDVKPKQDIYDYIHKGFDLDKIRHYTFEEIREFEELTKEDLLSPKLYDRLLAIKDGFDHQQAVTRCEDRALNLKFKQAFQQNFKQYKISNALKNANKNGRQTDFVGQPVKLNCGDWIADGFGVKKNEINNQNGNVSVKFASTIPILPAEILYNEDERTEKINIAFYKDGWKNTICERSTVASANKIIELANRGIEVNSDNAKLLVSYIADCVSKNLDTLPRLKAVSRLGWFGDNFIPYCTDLRFDGEEEHASLYQAVKCRGSFDAWVEEVTRLRENIYVRLMLATSFASVLIEKLDALPFVLHLWGGTGTGKTVALMVAMSVWGDPTLGKLVKTMNMTTNNMLSSCGFLCNLPFAGDELQTIKSKYTDYDQVIMKITEGIDRGRMQYDRMKVTKIWNNTILFTGEEPCTKAYSGGGVKNRVIEIEVDQNLVENGNQTANFVKQHHGHAGVKFMEQVRDHEHLREEFEALFKEIVDNCDTTDKQAISMAIILLADRIASEHIFHTAPLSVTDIAPFLTSVHEVDMATRAYEFVINLVARYSMRFASPENNTGEIWGRDETSYVLINKDVLISKMAEQGLDFDAVKKKWADKGWLVKSSQGRFIHQTKCWNIKGSYVKLKNFFEVDNDDPQFTDDGLTDEDLSFQGLTS